LLTDVSSGVDHWVRLEARMHLRREHHLAGDAAEQPIAGYGDVAGDHGVVRIPQQGGAVGIGERIEGQESVGAELRDLFGTEMDHELRVLCGSRRPPGQHQPTRCRASSNSLRTSSPP
jgi:hypothetical protein